MQLMGGHRSPSLRLLSALAAASKQMFPRTRLKWLSLDEMHFELAVLRERRIRLLKRSTQPGANA